MSRVSHVVGLISSRFCAGFVVVLVIALIRSESLNFCLICAAATKCPRHKPTTATKLISLLDEPRLSAPVSVGPTAPPRISDARSRLRSQASRNLRQNDSSRPSWACHEISDSALAHWVYSGHGITAQVRLQGV